jgi:hypothetical protein
MGGNFASESGGPVTQGSVRPVVILDSPSHSFVTTLPSPKCRQFSH